MDPTELEPPNKVREDRSGIDERRRAFGKTLKEAREQAGISVIGLAQATRISLNFLHALEDGALDKLPGRVFGRGFVRNIGKSLGIDPEPLVDEYEGCWAPSATPKGPQVPSAMATAVAGAKRKVEDLRLRPPKKSLIGAACAFVIAAGCYFTLEKWPEKATTSVGDATPSTIQKTAPSAPPVQTETPGEEAPEAKEATPVDPPKAATPETSAMEVEEKKPAPAKDANILVAASPRFEQVLEVKVKEPVRVKIGLDGARMETRELEPDTYRLTFEEAANLLIYDAGALSIEFNGRPLGSLGRKGRVRRISFAAKRPSPQNF